MSKRIITISREFGSGGRTIGKMVAEKLGIAFYDKELIEKIAQETGFSEKFIEEYGEHAPGTNVFSYSFLGRDANGVSMQDKIWMQQRKLILDLAEKEPCVIVGRCTDYILRDRTDCLNVFVHASTEKKVERIVKLYGETADKPENVWQIRTRNVASTIGTIQTGNGAQHRIITFAWTAENLGLNAAWI